MPPPSAGSGSLACCDSSQYQKYRSLLQKSPRNETIGPLACCDSSQYHKHKKSSTNSLPPRTQESPTFHEPNKSRRILLAHPIATSHQIRRALHSIKRALHSLKRAVHSIKRDLHSTNPTSRDEFCCNTLPAPTALTTSSSSPTWDSSPNPLSTSDDTHPANNR